MKLTKYFLTFLVIHSLCLFGCTDKEPWYKDKSDWSDLMLAVYKGKNEKVNKLIKNGATINYKSKTSFKLNALEVAIRKDNNTAFKLLIETDSISNLKDYIRLASVQKNASILKTIIAKGGNVNDTLENGYSVLMSSASFGSYEVFETILKNGANVHQTRKIDNWNALFFATFNGDIDKVKLLLKYGADKTYKDNNGRTAYDFVDSIYDHLNVSVNDKKELKRILK